MLIVEGFLATVLLGAGMDATQKIVGMWAGVGMFVLVLAAVWVLVWFKPEHLTFDKYAHLVDRGKIPYGTDEQPVVPEKRYAPGEKEEKGGTP